VNFSQAKENSRSRDRTGSKGRKAEPQSRYASVSSNSAGLTTDHISCACQHATHPAKNSPLLAKQGLQHKWKMLQMLDSESKMTSKQALVSWYGKAIDPADSLVKLCRVSASIYSAEYMLKHLALADQWFVDRVLWKLQQFDKCSHLENSRPMLSASSAYTKRSALGVRRMRGGSVWQSNRCGLKST
jgi:hypothetical protein